MKMLTGLLQNHSTPFIVVFGTALFVLTGVYLYEVSPFVKPALVAGVYPPTVLALTNSDRVANGVAPLTESLLLDQAAQAKADDEAARSYFSHTTPDGNSPLYFLDQVGYKYQNMGENLGLDYADSQDLETGWMNSPEHRANLLREVFTEAGVGVSSGTYEGAPATFAVEMFATPLPGQKNVLKKVPLRATGTASSSALVFSSTTPDANARYQSELEKIVAALTEQVIALRAKLLIPTPR